MSSSDLVKDYLRNPFLLWSLVVLFIITFDSTVLSAKLMELILLQNAYVPILFVSMTFAIIISSYPLRQGLKELAKRNSKGDKSFAILSGILLLLIPFLESVFFLSDPFVILGTAQPQIITDRETFEYIVLVKDFSQFLIIPLLGAFVHTNIKNKLVKEKFEIHGKLRNNFGFIFEIIIINAFMYGVYLLITSKTL